MKNKPSWSLKQNTLLLQTSQYAREKKHILIWGAQIRHLIGPETIPHLHLRQAPNSGSFSYHFYALFAQRFLLSLPFIPPPLIEPALKPFHASNRWLRFTCCTTLIARASISLPVSNLIAARQSRLPLCLCAYCASVPSLHPQQPLPPSARLLCLFDISAPPPPRKGRPSPSAAAVLHHGVRPAHIFAGKWRNKLGNRSLCKFERWSVCLRFIRKGWIVWKSRRCLMLRSSWFYCNKIFRHNVLRKLFYSFEGNRGLWLPWHHSQNNYSWLLYGESYFIDRRNGIRSRPFRNNKFMLYWKITDSEVHCVHDNFILLECLCACSECFFYFVQHFDIFVFFDLWILITMQIDQGMWFWSRKIRFLRTIWDLPDQFAN